MKLYEINEKLLRCVKVDEDYIIDGETGEIIDLDAIDALLMERDEKILNIARWIKQLSAEAEAVKQEKLKLGKRQKSLENKAESLTQYLEKVVMPDEKVSDATSVVKWRKSTVCEGHLESIKDNPDFAKYLKIEVSENKADIKAALKKGETIGDYALVEKQKVSVG